ncbi:DUF3142 domain-containing protein [Azospirillum sp. sgz301742]
MRYTHLVLLLLGLVARSAGPAPIPAHDAYVWQRLWTPPVIEAVQHSADFVRAWRVLVAEADGAGRWALPGVDWGALAASRRPVVAVVRIDGQLQTQESDALAADIAGIVARAGAHGIPLAGLEIDHDCATARLAGYIRFLANVRGQLPAGLPVTITALPAWLSAPLFEDLAAQPDEIVLQVHAVRNPRFGLFDARLALGWAEALARRTARPFRVALPTYGSRVHWGEDGRLVAVESEAPTLNGDGAASELAASPAAVAGLLRALERSPPRHFAGVAWFRLPITTDARAWSPATWRAVVRGGSLRTTVVGEARATATPGLADIVLANAGDIDADLPRSVVLDDSCTLADGINGYRLRRDGKHPTLESSREGTLRGGERRVIGWMRCAMEQATKREMIDVRP